MEQIKNYFAGKFTKIAGFAGLAWLIYCFRQASNNKQAKGKWYLMMLLAPVAIFVAKKVDDKKATSSTVRL